jgi:protein-L-isoaspartate(D-aspartate) O-methyltransferase
MGPCWLPLFGLGAALAGPTDDAAALRDRMVDEQLVSRDITDARVLAAMRAVPRHRFLPPVAWPRAHADSPVPIGAGQTMSQPYIVALMTQALRVEPGMRVLEVGTGSGYQAAVLAELGARVTSIEIVPELSAQAAGNLRVTGYLDRVELVVGDGYAGRPDDPPWDRIIVTAAPDAVPPALLAQLGPGGVLLIPVGPRDGVQVLRRFTRATDGTLKEETLLPVRFVPLVHPD